MVDGVRTHVLHRSRVTGSELFFVFPARLPRATAAQATPSLLLIFIFSVHMSFLSRAAGTSKSPRPHFFETESGGARMKFPQERDVRTYMHTTRCGVEMRNDYCCSGAVCMYCLCRFFFMKKGGLSRLRVCEPSTTFCLPPILSDFFCCFISCVCLPIISCVSCGGPLVGERTAPLLTVKSAHSANA